MEDITEKAYEAGAGTSMADTYNVFTVILVGLILLGGAYLLYCMAKGMGTSVKISDIFQTIIRIICFTLITIAFFTYERL